jgi:hypothetical protein
MNMALGRALMSAAGSGTKLAKGSTRASYWADHPQLIRALKKGPSKIIISLNGNGIDGTAELIAEILKRNKTTPVTWTGAPPPIRRDKSSFKYLNSDSGFEKAYESRLKKNKAVRDMMPAGWTFIDPYDYITYDEPLRIGDKTFVSGYTCESCDGIHLPSSVAKEYVSKIQGFL